MSLLKANSVQIGQSATATQNFTLSVPSSPDGTIKLARGNSGATTADVLTVDASGNVTTTLATGSVKFSQLSTSATEADNIAKRTAKAWVNFNGTTNVGGNCTIRDDFNVSTVADNGFGDYTINFSAALSSASYCVTGCATHDSGGYTSTVMIDRDNSGMQAGSCRINVISGSSALVDAEFVCAAMFL